MTEPKRKLVRNAAECTHCHSVIESKHRHDFVHCKCERIYVDGGLDYLRRGYMKESDIIERSEWVEE